jgi:hypothetical protein
MGFNSGLKGLRHKAWSQYVWLKGHFQPVTCREVPDVDYKYSSTLSLARDDMEVGSQRLAPAAVHIVDCVWNVMAQAQKKDFVFRRNGRVHLNREWRQFSRLLAAAVCASAVITLDTPCSEVVWRVLSTHSIHQFPLHFPPVRHRVPSRFNWTLQQALCTKHHNLKVFFSLWSTWAGLL